MVRKIMGYWFGGIKIGSIVLLLTKGTSNSTIHYLTSQGQLHQIADSLTAYLRLMLLYMGLPDWPLVHLKMELSYWNKVGNNSL